VWILHVIVRKVPFSLLRFFVSSVLLRRILIPVDSDMLSLRRCIIHHIYIVHSMTCNLLMIILDSIFLQRESRNFIDCRPHCSLTSSGEWSIAENDRDILWWHPLTRTAVSRHRWAVKQLDTKDQASSPFYSATIVPRYPFRLHLKIQKADWEERQGVIDSLCDLAGRILHTEWCHSFMRGTIYSVVAKCKRYNYAW